MTKQVLIRGRRHLDDPMTADELREWLVEWDMTIDDFAYITGYDRRTITGWGKPKHGRMQHVPLVVVRLVDAWQLTGGPPMASELQYDPEQAMLVITSKTMVRYRPGGREFLLGDEE